MRTIAIINQKGGCGKTTVSINLASALAKAGKKTLLVDMDPQSHCAVGLAVPEEQIEQSIYDVLISCARDERIKLSEILWQIFDGIDLAPASIDLAAFDQQMAGIVERDNCLKFILEDVATEYDYAIIDCPPAVGLLTFNALRAATDVIVPVETGYFSLHGLSKQLDTLSVLCQQCSQKIDVHVLTSMYDIRTRMAREIVAELRKHFGEKMLETVINFNTKLKEAASLGQPVIEYDPVCTASKGFQALAREIVDAELKIDHIDIVDLTEESLDSITTSAEDILSAIESSPKAPPQIQQQKTLENKLADFYGVRQTDDAVAFSMLYPRAANVQIAGDFNSWKPEQTPMEKIGLNGTWHAKLNLPSGKYRYRIVVDGQWQQDPYNEWTEVNPFGEFNSILEVK